MTRVVVITRWNSRSRPRDGRTIRARGCGRRGARRVSTDRRRLLSRLRLGHTRSARTHATSLPRHDHSSRFGARVPIDPAAIGVCGAKHAIHGFTDSVRSELLHDKVNIDLYMVQLLAVNTPQFGWCVNRMDKSLQPVPPIFQPEIIAEVIHHASLHPRREIFLAPHGANAPGERPAQPSHRDYESLRSTTTCRHLQNGR